MPRCAAQLRTAFRIDEQCGHGIGQSTRVYNRMTGEISYGRVPPYSVVVSGQLPAKDGSHSLYCAVIVKQVDAKTRSKTSVNELLRGLAD